LAESGSITFRDGRPVGTLESTGTIVGLDGTPLGRVLPDSSVVWFVDEPRKILLYVRDETDAIVGRLYNKVSPRLVVAFGILLFAYTAWLMGHYTLQTSSTGIINVLIIQGIAFLRDVSRSYETQVSAIYCGGMIGPRCDAYSLNRTITAEEADEYHSFQLEVLKRAEVDFASAVTFNNIPEATGVARAAKRLDIPLSISFTLDSNHRLKSGPSLREALAAVDAEAGAARPDFYGINCSHPLEFEPAMEPGDWMQRVRSLRPNASTKDKGELCQIGNLDEGDPEDLGQRMGALARRYPHIDVWGGCCGTWDKHLREIARNVRRSAR
jgi:S-methylmethionine-dependent homocysteine/selenocysteine methylase